MSGYGVVENYALESTRMWGRGEVPCGRYVWKSYGGTGLLGGLVLIGLELVIPSFTIIWFGLGAVLVRNNRSRGQVSTLKQQK